MKLILNKKENIEVVLEKVSKLSQKSEKLQKLNRLGKDAGSLYVDLDLENMGSITLLVSDDAEENRQAGFNLVKKVRELKLEKLHINFSNLETADLVSQLVEGLYYGQYDFNTFRNDKVEEKEFQISLLLSKEYEQVLEEVKNLTEAVFFTRNVVNLPPNVIYPESYANKIVELFKGSDVEVKVLNKEEMLKLNMHAAVSVGMGSDKDPRFVILTYKPNKQSDEFIAFVGKGITYDSGGYALKPASGMLDMKTDMAGSAAVVGAIKAISSNKINQNVVGVMALCENLVSGRAYKNGDIISSMKGLNIEVDNTDAEGRVTLADSIYYAASQVNSKFIVELATLTGACIMALGSDVTGSVTTDEKLFKQVHEAGLKSGELIWQLPITKKLESAVKGRFGGLKNVAAGGGGAITAGIFLTKFTENKPFVHLDIAGTSYISPYKYYTDGATGVGVRTLYNLVKSL